VILALLAGCGSSGKVAPSVTGAVSAKPHHINGPTHPGGNTTKGE
jgi:hypothetical protein